MENVLPVRSCKIWINPELVGRLHIISTLKVLEGKDLLKILTETKKMTNF